MRKEHPRAAKRGPSRRWLTAWAATLLAGCTSDGKLKSSEGPPPAADAAIAPARADAADANLGPGVSLPGGDAAGPMPTGAACAGSGDAPVPGDCAAMGVAISPAYLPDYTCFDLGPVPGLPLPPHKYGGLTLTQDPCSTTLLIGGAANKAEGKLYSIKVRRDGMGRITGFAGTATVVADAPFNDGGITFGPRGILFLARWPVNQLQQTKPGSMLADKVIDLKDFGVTSGAASLGFVPSNAPGAGLFKLLTYPGGHWYTVLLVPDDVGTYNVKRLETVDRASPGGPEGFVYVAAGNPKFPAHSVLISEWDANRVSSYEVDAAAEPILATRKDFLTGLNGPEGAYRDPATGDFLFSTFTKLMTTDRVIIVRGFLPITVD